MHYKLFIFMFLPYWGSNHSIRKLAFLRDNTLDMDSPRMLFKKAVIGKRSPENVNVADFNTNSQTTTRKIKSPYKIGQ